MNGSPTPFESTVGLEQARRTLEDAGRMLITMPVDRWEQGPLLRSFHAAAADGFGRVFVFCGRENQAFNGSAEVERYDPRQGQWAEVTAPPPAIAQRLSDPQRTANFCPINLLRTAATTDHRGSIYLMGGEYLQGRAFGFTSSGGALELTGTENSVYRYDPAANTWSVAPPMPTPRAGLAAATDGQGLIYAIGGVNFPLVYRVRDNATFNTHEGATVKVLTSVEVYNPRTGVWSVTTPLPSPRSDLAAVTDRKGRIYAIGGLGLLYRSLADVDRYDPATRQWVPLPALPTPRGRAAAALGQDGRIYVFGGETVTWGPMVNWALAATTVVEAFDPETNKWTKERPLSVPRAGLSATPIANGTLLLVGGSGDSPGEVWSPAAHS